MLKQFQTLGSLVRAAVCDPKELEIIAGALKRDRGQPSPCVLRGVFTWSQERGRIVAPNGKLIRVGKIINSGKSQNGNANVGINSFLGVNYHADTQITDWYLGMINNAGYSALAAGDTMGSHAGWAEFTAYSEAARPTWSPGAAAGQAISNSAVRDFTITGAAATLQGVFLTSVATKGGTTGVLNSTTLFATPIPVVAADVIHVTYSITGS